MMTEQELRVFMLEEFKKTYAMGVADFYKMMMSLPNIDDDAKNVMTFSFRSFTANFSRQVGQKIEEARGGDSVA